MAIRPINTLEICSGVGMLGEGLRAGLGYLGIETRTVCHIEREAYAAAVLASRIEEGSLDPAPIWSDLLTFDAASWRGAVDCIVAGFPCQDLSVAGRRAGLDGKRSGLFFDILDIADACGAKWLALENVAGIASATAAVVDEESASEYVGNHHAKGFSQVGVEDGRLLERAAARVMGELADRGWDAEWITISASDVGASHGRARWFCWAWRQVGHPGRDAGSTQHGQQSEIASGGTWKPGEAGCERELGDTGLQHQHLQQRQDGAEHSRTGQPMAHAERAERGPQCAAGVGSIQGHDGHGREADCGAGVADAVLADTPPDRRPEGRPESSGQQGRPDAAECGGAVADSEDNGHQSGARCGVDWDGLLPTEPCTEVRNSCWTSQPVGCGPAVADTSSPRQQGREQCGTCTDHRGGGASTWIS